jgi:hypothetical protein
VNKVYQWDFLLAACLSKRELGEIPSHQSHHLHKLMDVNQLKKCIDIFNDKDMP